MKEISLTARIKRYFQAHPNDWINGGAIEEMAMKVVRANGAHYKASHASRRLREAESGIGSNGKPCEKFLINKIEKGSVWYKYLPTEKIITNYHFSDGKMIAREEKVYG